MLVKGKHMLVGFVLEDVIGYQDLVSHFFFGLGEGSMFARSSIEGGLLSVFYLAFDVWFITI